LKRAWGEPAFSAEERTIVDCIHRECGWVFASSKTALSADQWSPRERAVLDLLLTGATEKSAAASLGVSPHTVHDYVKAIYRKLGIGSRSELMTLALGRPSRMTREE
jgi:DNA-binding NarL/FixJ family response regulator